MVELVKVVKDSLRGYFVGEVAGGRAKCGGETLGMPAMRCGFGDGAFSGVHAVVIHVLTSVAYLISLQIFPGIIIILSGDTAKATRDGESIMRRKSNRSFPSGFISTAN